MGKIIYNYNTTKQMFNEKNCVLLTSEEEYNDMCLKNIQSKKFNILASCSHNHSIFFKRFVKYSKNNENYSLLCKNCCSIKKSVQQKKIYSENKLVSLEQELNCINYLKSLCIDEIDIIKSEDSCEVDIIIKPKNIIQDEWIGIQIKTTNKSHEGYHFKIKNNYTCLIILFCNEEKKIWAIPGLDIKNMKTISIGVKKSKYDKYFINNNSLSSYLQKYYYNNLKNQFEKINIPKNQSTRTEKDMKKYREKKLNFINFENNYMEGLVYDFKINNKKFQEKSNNVYKNKSYSFILRKSNGSISSKKQYKPYEIGDNDFYWLNCIGSNIFFIIPEEILVNKNIIGTNKIKTLYITPHKIHKNYEWINEYMFNYENIEKEKLLNIIYK
jgi:hypothetical protein